jgi:hypothetical protein
MPSSNLNVVNLDFDAAKASLRDFLRSQTQFLDYNFEGSGLSVLLDILSYNTHYLAFYYSMLGSEMFLDSAVLRSSVVSLAKHLGYTTQSIRAARAIISITITPPQNDTSTNMVIEQGSRFRASLDGDVYYFVTDQVYSASLTNGVFLFPSVTLVEGIPYIFRSTVDSTIPNQKFILPSAFVDTSTLTVQIQKSITDPSTDTYTLADNFLQVTSTTQAYFLQETENGCFEVYFGDGIVGRDVNDGNVVLLNYVICHGPTANGASTFTPSQPLGGYSLTNTRVTTVIPASGGADPEDVEKIRFNAPKAFETQGRAVTAADYNLLIKTQYKNADSVIVWGGETEDPPQYGKVFISIKPVNGFVITEAEKTLVLADIISSRNIVSVIPQFVDPDYTYLEVSSTVRYIASNTTKTIGNIQTLAYNAIVNYATSELDQFYNGFKYSRLLAAIDNCDLSVTNNLTTIRMKKIFKPTLNAVQSYTFNMNAAVTPGSFSSTSFITISDPLLNLPYVAGNTYRIVDDASGNLNMIQSSIGNPDRIARPCGRIDYKTGVFTIATIMPAIVDANGQISVSMTTSDNKIEPIRNNILFINPSDIKLTVVPVTQ